MEMSMKAFTLYALGMSILTGILSGILLSDFFTGFVAFASSIVVSAFITGFIAAISEEGN